MSKIYIVAIKQVEIFQFDTQELRKEFIEEIEEENPDVIFATSEITIG